MYSEFSALMRYRRALRAFFRAACVGKAWIFSLTDFVDQTRRAMAVWTR